MKRFLLLPFICVVLFTGLSAHPPEQRIIPLFENLSTYHRKVTTRSAEAQRYFDQGLTLYYGFNHEAAILSFRQAILLDPDCAMAWWGQAISAGPNINNPVMDSASKAAAWETVQKAQEHLGQATPLERGLIQALAARYAWPPPTDRKGLDSAYANAMRNVYRAFPDDPDVGALFADALLNIRPWDYWKADGTPQPGTKEIVSVLENSLSRAPDHPGVCHFYIHTMEASSEPERALPAANELRNRVPGAGHLVHMPSHIDIRLGHYSDAIEANRKAIIADSVWVQSGGLYTIYRAHNFHFLAYAAMFNGQKETATRAANEMIRQIPLELVLSFPDFLDGFYAIPTHVMVRFGMWEELIAQPAPPEELSVTTAFWHYGRTVAFAALGRVPEAEREKQLLLQAYEKVPDSRLFGNNPAKKVLDIGLNVASGELEYRKANYDQAFRYLRLAVEGDDSLRYDEPWGWMMPVRHALGALLTEQGKYDEAEKVYRRDLEIHPGNGWALKGLSTCYHMTGRQRAAVKTEALFAEAWKDSDIMLKASCFCAARK